MLEIIKEIIEHDDYSVYLDPKFWENDENLSFAPLVDYVVNELPKFFSNTVADAISKCETLEGYENHIETDIKAGFCLNLTDDDVEDKGLSLDKGINWLLWDISKHMGVYLKINYFYKLDPNITVPVYYVFDRCLPSIAPQGCVLFGSIIRNNIRHTRLYDIVSYLLVNSIEFKYIGDFDSQDIVVPSIFNYNNCGRKHRTLLDIDKAIKELKAKDRESGLEYRENVRLNLLKNRRYDIIDGAWNVIEKMTPKFVAALIDKANTKLVSKSKVKKLIDVKKEEIKEREEKDKEYQEKLRIEREDNTRRLQRIANATFF